MVGHSRYKVGNDGVGHGGILENKLGIKDQKTLDDFETILLSDAYEHFLGIVKARRVDFDLSFLFHLHKYFLGTLYAWAGKSRRINISKEDVLFASAEHLEKALKEFEQELKKHISLKKDSKTAVAKKLAFVHNELNSLHPFREGNGRTIRLFVDLMAASVGYEPIEWDLSTRERYLEACKHGIVLDHAPMQKIIYKGLRKQHDATHL